MADFTGIVELIRKTVVETVERSKPSGVYFGKVISVTPIQINVDQKLILTEEFIVLGRYITEFSVDYTIDGEMWHGLRIDDELLLVREQGGQRYCVIDWVKRVEEDTRPAWIKEGEVISDEPLEIKVNDYLTLTDDNLILCQGVMDYQTYMSFDNPKIKQKVKLYDKAEKESEGEPLLSAVHPGDEPHQTRPDDTPPPKVDQTTDIVFEKKWYENTLGIEDENGEVPDKIELPALHEITVYNHLHVGDKVLLVCERSSQKWYVVDYTYREVLDMWRNRL